MKAKLFAWALTLFCLSYPIYIYKSLYSYKHSWWFYTWNDSTQAISAAIITSLLGEPYETVVWPGTTLLLPYLYKSLIFPHNFYSNFDDVIISIREIVQFQRSITLIYALLFNFLFYILLRILTKNNFISLAMVITIIFSPSYAMAINESRPELLSIVFAMLSTLIILSKRFSLMQKRESTSFLLGLTIGFSILSKIQILPFCLFIIIIFIIKLWNENNYENINLTGKIQASFISIITLVMMLGFIKSDSLSNTGMYSLSAYPKYAGLITYITGTSLITVLAINSLFRRRAAKFSLCILFLFFGLAFSIIISCAPSLIYGGLSVFLENINRLEYGIVSVISYGPGFGDNQKWGSMLTWSEKFKSIIDSQSMSGIPLIGSTNIAFLAILSLAIPTIFNRSTAKSDFRFKFFSSLLCIIFGCIFDIISLLRLDGHNLMPSQYHIYSNIFYLLSIGISFSAISFYSHSLGGSITKYVSLCIISVAVLFKSSVIISQLEVVRMWNSCESIETTMDVGIDSIQNVTPSFFRLTKTSIESLKSQRSIEVPCIALN